MACQYGCVNGRVLIPATGAIQACPDCTTATDILDKSDIEFTKILKKLNIPEEYNMDNFLDDTLVTHDTRKHFTGESISRITGVLKEINSAIFAGHTVKRAMYIYAPTMELKMWAFNALLQAYERGISLAPLISINTLFDIQRSRDFEYAEYETAKRYQGAFGKLTAAQKQFFSGYVALENLSITYSEIIDSELLILEATGNTTEKTWFALADILSERENRNLSTYVIGYFSEKQLSECGARYILRDTDALFKLGKMETHGLVSNRAQSFRDTSGTSSHTKLDSQKMFNALNNK